MRNLGRESQEKKTQATGFKKTECVFSAVVQRTAR